MPSSDAWDIVIVGAGSAGMPCAIAAAEYGSRVVIVDKSHEIGGTLHMSGGHMSGGGTRRQREHGIEDSPDLHFEDVMRISHGEADPTLLRLAVDEAPRTLDWLDDLGLPWDPATPKIIFSPAHRQPREIYVNARGDRFIAEDDPSPDTRERRLLEQPNHQFWCIWDERAIDDGACIIRQWNADQLRAAAEEGKSFWKADSIERLARKAGIDAAGLVAAVNRWNESTRTGDDPLGRRDVSRSIETPPFYALLTHATSLITFGGIAVDGELRVMDEAGKPIPNLYAAGEILGAAVFNGQAFCGGMLQTPAISFGRILGRTLAR
ncbi:MAG: FAD-dependent oxidoreductase [Blastocatellia bacterium]